ncbi:acyl-CoA carboxylase epsilon subunit [Streptomyces montanisoli]|uniref:Acyl-CoA carboxylase subunit epsilon n=1 Tax=Streptomyces montanisoli TaxID=2798581 RepID=A0A940MJL4_9ACTN|nr:acyl-CoA carboxylase epsilon subunit [Streptomyces montanisoli]MBP0461300.1 acyl-CoA carboxylase subunit epsilon [Streptomyces montanisoli]
MSAAAEPLVRVERGEASPEELAGVMAVLLAVRAAAAAAAGNAADAAAPPGESAVSWPRGGAAPSPESWASGPGPAWQPPL